MKKICLNEAARHLASFLELKHPDFVTLTEKQAKDLFACSVYRVWLAYMILTERIEP